MFQNWRVWRNAYAMLAATAISLAAVPTLAETTLERIKRTDKVRVAVANERPYGYVDDNGRLTGEAPEIAREVLARIDPGIELEPVVVNFGELIAELRAGHADIIAAGMYVTPRRCEKVAFSTPTYKMGEAFAVLAGNPKDLSDFESIYREPDAKVGVMAGTVEYNYAYAAGIPGDRALLYADYDAAIRALRRGEIDAVAMTALTVRTLIAERGLDDIESTTPFYPEDENGKKVGYGAFAFRKADTALRDAFNSHLKDFVGSPAHRETVSPFGFTPDMLPDKATAELCAGQ